MNATFEAVKNGQEVATEELFGMVNPYNFADIIIRDEDEVATTKIPVNKFIEYKDRYDFSQVSSDWGVSVKKSDIISVKADYDESIDGVLIRCEMDTGKSMIITIYHISSNNRLMDDKYRIDLEDLENFLDKTLGDDAEYHCSLATLTNECRMSVKINAPEHTYINTLDDSDRKLHISGLLTTLEVPVIDGDCNEFYMKEEDFMVEVLVKPFWHPFDRIYMMFIKNNN